MPDPYRKVQTGDRVEHSASVWNAMVDAAQTIRQQQLSRESGDLTTSRRSDLIAVRNDTGTNFTERYGIIGLDGPVFAPADSLDGFQREIVLKGVVPTAAHFGRFGILNEPVRDGAIARAWVAGVRQAKIDVLAEDDRFADVDPSGATDKLLSTPTGTVQIIWREGDDDVTLATGEQWGVVRFGGISSPMVYAKVQSGNTITAASGSTLGHGNATICSRSGNTLTDDGEVVDVKNAAGAVVGPKYILIGYADGAWSQIVAPC